MTELDVIVFGSAIVDFICYVQRLPKPGETLHGKTLETGYGGKGANQCVAAARLGAKTAFIGYLGTDSWGEDYLAHLKDENVETKFVESVHNQPTGIAQISVAENGENHIIIVTGANKKLSPGDVTKSSEYFEKSKVLICQLETPEDATIAALKSFKGVSILNTAPVLPIMPSELFCLPTILCANETEAASMTERNVDTIDDAKLAIMELVEMGAKTVILTLGERGVVYSTEADRRIIHVEAIKVEKVVDTTGAGDAFIGSLAYFIAKYPEQEMHQKIGAACYVAAISVQSRGTQSSFPHTENISIDFNSTTFNWSYVP